MKEVKISASVLAADLRKIERHVRRVEEGGADYIHIDFITEDFIEHIGLEYEGKSVGIEEMERIRKVTNLPFDVHIMAMNPQDYIDDFIIMGADIITIHYEATDKIDNLYGAIDKIVDNGVKLGIAFNPDRAINDIIRFLSTHSSYFNLFNKLDIILIMSVWPGKSGQEFISGTEKKVEDISRLIKRRNLKTQIEVDGGIGPDNARILVQSGADILVAGNSIFGQPDIAEATRKLKQIANS